MKRAKKIERLLWQYLEAGDRYAEANWLARSGAYSGEQGDRAGEECEKAFEERDKAWDALLRAIRAVPD